ncbi:MAG: PhoX family protein [Actinomycetes bacterium]
MTELTDRPVAIDDLDPDDLSSNPSAAPCFRDVVEARLSRRSVLQGGMLTAAAFLTTRLADTPAAHAARPAGRGRPAAAAGGTLGFTGIGLSKADDVLVPAGYTAVPFIPWGTPIQPGTVSFRPGTAPFVTDGNTPEEQARQVGMHHDGMHYFPLPSTTGPRGLLVVNHEYTDEDVLHTGSKQPPVTDPANPGRTISWQASNKGAWTKDMVRKSQAAHGVSVLEVRQKAHGDWEVATSARNRRITATTPMTFSGPAADSPLLDTGAPADGTNPVGTMNNCGHGVTPWGSYLACEENFNGYFRVDDAASFTPEQQSLLTRYGVGGDRYYWAEHDPRYLVTPQQPNEPNRFGWIVEIDPSDPTSTPVKRTALGRVKHEGAFVHEAKTGHAVVYMGDDQAGDYAYKYVSARPWRTMVKQGVSPLDEGTLYVARFHDDGTGEWLPLVHGRNGLTPANGFADQGDVLVKTRLAADVLGATPMDRPEWTTVDPTTGMVYLTLTNHSRRAETNGPNPRTENIWGQIVRWAEDGNHTTRSFRWDLLLLAGPGDGVDGSTISAEDAFGSPDGLWADPDGRVWIQTDGRQPDGSHNQMLAADPTSLKPGAVADTPDIRRFLTGPVGCEVTGVITTPDQRTMFINIQHPTTGAWPDGPGGTPRSSSVLITKNDGGVIGT